MIFWRRRKRRLQEAEERAHATVDRVIGRWPDSLLYSRIGHFCEGPWCRWCGIMREAERRGIDREWKPTPDSYGGSE